MAGEDRTLPKEVFVRWGELDEDEPALYIYESMEDAVEDDGPTLVGIYRLVEVKHAEKVLKVSNVR